MSEDLISNGIKREYESVVSRINLYDKQYYQENQSLITDSEYDRIIGFTTARDIIVNLSCLCEEIELYETDDIPGLSDSYYEYLCGDYDEFVKQLRAFMIQLLIDIDLDNTDHYY